MLKSLPEMRYYLLAGLLATIAALTAMMYYDAAQADPERVATSVYTLAGTSGVQPTGSMEPTLNGDSQLTILPIRVGDIEHGMIVIAEMGGLVVVKRVERRGSILFLVGDNRANTTRYILHGDKILGFVRAYTTDGVTYKWTGELYERR